MTSSNRPAALLLVLTLTAAVLAALFTTTGAGAQQDPAGDEPEGGFVGDTHVLTPDQIADRSDELGVAAVQSAGVAFAGMTPITPARILDTRNANGVPGTSPLGRRSQIGFQVAGRGGVPANGVDAVALNVTITGATASSFLTVWPTDAARPNASSLNMTAGLTTANLVIAKVAADGTVSVYNNEGSVHVIADVVAYSVDADHLTSLTPERILDTRNGLGTGVAAPVPRRSSIDLTVTGVGGVPASGVDAVVLNVTATEPTAASFVTVWPTGSSRPTASSLNVVPGQTVPNLVVAKVGANGQVSLYNNEGTTHLLADVVAWIPTGSAYVPLNPTRVMDSRTGLGLYGEFFSGPTPGILDRLPGPIGSGDTVTLEVSNAAGLPFGTSTVVVNITAVAPANGQETFVTAWPTASPRPNASTLNLGPGDTVANPAMVGIDEDGVLNLYNNRGELDIIVDVVGYFVARNVADTPDDFTGPQVHIVHAIPAGSPGELAPAATFGADEVRAELRLVNDFLSANGDRRLRYDTDDGQIEVSRVNIAATKAELEDFSLDGPFVEMIDQMILDGFTDPSKIYLVFVDGVSRNLGTICGEAIAIPPALVAADGYDIVDDIQFPRWAFMWTGSCSGTPVAAPAWPGVASTVLHEFFHTIGAAPECGAESDGGGHTTDPTDLMYFSVNPTSALDPGRDDYWDHGATGCTIFGDVLPHPDLRTSDFLRSG